MKNKPISADPNNDAGIHSVRAISVLDLLENIFYFRWHFIVTFLIIASFSALYALLATPIYTSDSLIQVEEKKGTSLGALSQVANALGAQQSPVLGEIEILRSRSVIGRAVENLKANIETRVDNRLPIVGGWLSRFLDKGPDGLTIPLWSNSTLAWGGEQLIFSEFSVPKRMEGRSLYLKIHANESWSLYTADDKKLLEGNVKDGMSVAMDGALRVEIDILKARPGTVFRIVAYSLQSRISQILDNLTVAETRRQSNILKLTYQSSNPSYAASILNAIGDVYVRQNISRRSEKAELSLDFLDTELPKLRKKLDASEKALNDFRAKSKTIDITSEIKELLTKTTTVEKAQLETELKYREYAERYDTAHPALKALASQVVGLKAESEQLNRQIARLPIVQQDFIRLARDVEVNSQLYVSLLNNAQQLQIAKAGTTGNVAIVDRALPPELPSRPRKALVVAIGSLLGMLTGFLLCQGLSMISRIVRDPKRLEQETNLPILAILPLDTDQILRNSSKGTEAFLLANAKPASPSAEAMRSLRTATLFKLSEKPRSKVVLITSAVPAQGKSFISANLCYLFAATGKKTLLIEADIRLGSIRKYVDYDLKSAQGLSAVLLGEEQASKAIITNVFPNMDFLPAGRVVRNPGDLLAGDKIKELIAEMAETYDCIIIDCPPLLPVHDARSLAKSADVTLFVARQDYVTLSEINDAIDVFAKSGNRFDGVIFNGFIPSKMRYGYGYGYGYRNSYRYGKRNSYGGYGGYGAYGGYGNKDDETK